MWPDNGIKQSLDELKLAVNDDAQQNKTCCAQLKKQLDIIEQKLEKILATVYRPATTFIAVITINQQGAAMAQKAGQSAKATADLQVADNGTFSLVLFFLDALGIQTTVPAGLSATYTA